MTLTAILLIAAHFLFSSALAFTHQPVRYSISSLNMSKVPMTDTMKFYDIPKVETGIYELRAKYPGTGDGAGVKIAIMDTGCDLLAAGLSGTTSDGVTPKYLDFIDCTGDGDVPMDSKVIEFEYKDGEENTVEGLSGRKLVLGEWAKDVKEMKLGAIRLYELLPRSILRRVKKERKEAFMMKHQTLISSTQLKLDKLNASKNTEDEKDAADKQKKELKLMLEQLNLIVELYDEDAGPLMDIIMLKESDVWKAVIDLEANGDLTKSVPMAPFAHARQVSQLGFGSHVTFCIQVYDDGKTLSIVTDSGSHGTHVAGIAASYFKPEGESEGDDGKASHDLDGVAPGAQILALKIGDGRLGSAETGTGLIRGLIAAKKYGCDLVNLSFGEPSWQPDCGRTSAVFEKAFREWGMTVFTSAGNDGPALSSLGTPGSLTNIITVGAWASASMQTEQYSTLPPAGDSPLQSTSYYFSSRGPTPDGLLPDVCGPGGAVAPVPRAALQGKAQYHGTSMSSPNVCGVAACVLSSIRKNGVNNCGPYELKRALKNSAVSSGIVDPFSQGAGLVSALNCADYIINNHGKKGQDLAIDVSVPSRNNARGIYIRDEIELYGPMTFNVLVKPRFSHANRRTAREMEDLLSFQMHLSLKSSDSWAICPESMTLMSAEERNGQTFSVRLNTQGLEPGVHYASVDAIDPSDSARGPLFSLPITVIIPHSKFVSCDQPKLQLKESSSESIQLKENGLDLTATFELLQGMPNRRFITVPVNAEWVTIKLRSTDASTAGNSPRIYLHAIPFVRGDMPNTEMQLKRVVSVNDGTEKEFHVSVKGGSTLEICLQTLWLANPVPAFVTADVEFHSLNARSPTLISSQPITITGAAEFARLSASAPLRTEQLNPFGSLKSVLRTLRPDKCEITLGSIERDAEPPSDADLASNVNERPTQIYEMRLSYKFKVENDKPIDIRPSFPSLFNQLYDSPLDSQIWAMLDSSSKIVSYGSCMHHASSSSLKKGDYTINLLLRHPNFSALDQMKDIPCEISFGLKDALACKVYGELDKASTPAVKDDGRTTINKRLLQKGSHQDLYVARPIDELPKWIQPGDVLAGALSLDKEKEAVTSMKLLYVAPPKVKAKNGDEENAEKKENSLEDVVFKAKLTHLAGLRAKNATVYQEIAAELKQERPASVPLLAELLSFALEGPLPDNITNDEVYRAAEIDKIYNTSQKVNGGVIDVASLAQYFGLNEPEKDELDADESAKELNKDMTEQRDLLKRMLLYRASVHGSIAAKTSNSAGLAKFNEAVKEMKQWIKLESLKDDDEKIKFTITLARHARLCQERDALALSLLLKAKKDLTSGKNLKQLDEELIVFLESSDSSHLKDNLQESLYCRYPVSKRSV